ncbi:MAG: multiheme c-type cytochrome [Desulfobacteria bacterium]
MPMTRSTIRIAVLGIPVIAIAFLLGCGSSGKREGQIGTAGTSGVLVQKGDPVLAPADGYVGSERCAPCHPDIFAEWGGTLHNKPLKTVAEYGDAAFVDDADGNGVNDFKDGLDLAGNADFSVYGANAPKLGFSGGKYFMTIGAVRYEVQRVQGGNGYWKQRYQTRIGRSYYILPVQYNEVQKTYTAYDGSDWYDGSNQPRYTAAYGSDNLVLQLDALNNGTFMMGTSLSWENRCAGCHQTGLQVQTGASTYGGSSVTEAVSGYVELNIGCEACHGPGGNHVVSRHASDIINPGTFTLLGTEGVKRANEVCGSCHSRGSSITLPGMSVGMDAPALLSGSAAVPFLPGNNLLNDLGVAGAYVTLTTSASAFWGSANFAASDVNSKFPLYNASKNNHQQWMDIQQGPHGADNPYDVPCWGCHSPHSAANEHMIATTVKEGGVTKVTNTKNDDDTLCLACHNGAYGGDFSAVSTADVQAVAGGGSSTVVETAIRGHMVKRANMDVPLDLANGVGRCTSCHMPKTARSAAFTSSYLDADGKRKGDIHSHTLKILMPNTNVLDVTNTWFNKSLTDNSVRTSMPNSCSACHNASSASSATAGDYEMYGWARSGHADYLDAGIGGYGDRTNRSSSNAEAYNSTSNTSCVPCHTEAGYVTYLSGGTQSARFIAPENKNFLGCYACHDSAASASVQHVRQIASFTFPSGLSVSGAGNSMVCFKCHGGRASKAAVDGAVPSGGVYSFVHVHYFPAAAMLYGPLAQGGYEYGGKTYVNNEFHIGVSCKGCHMAAGPSNNWNIGGHTLNMASGGALNTTACSNLSCHGAVSTFDVNGNGRQATVTALLGQLDTALASSGVVKASPFEYPYFTNITTADQLGAAYNYKFVYNDPGAYVHNFRYAAQLLYDSLDKLDNGSLDGSVAFAGKQQFGR